MNTQKASRNEWRKVEEVVLSCKTKEQLLNAFNYYELWVKKRKKWLLNDKLGLYAFGEVNGIFAGMFTKYGAKCLGKSI